jgi:hypothetical protein
LPEGAEDTLGVSFEEGTGEADVFGDAVFAGLLCLFTGFLWHYFRSPLLKIEMNIDSQNAQDIAVRYVNAHYEIIGDVLVILEESTIVKPYGWVFFYDSQRFLKTGKFSYRLAGNGPVLVTRDGEIYPFGTVHEVDFYLNDYEDKFISQEKVISVYHKIGLYLVSISAIIEIVIFISAIIKDVLRGEMNILQAVVAAIFCFMVGLIPNWIGLYVFSRRFLISQQEIQIIWCFGKRRKVYHLDSLQKVQDIHPIKIKRIGSRGNIYLTFDDGKTSTISDSCENFKQAKNFLYMYQMRMNNRGD